MAIDSYTLIAIASEPELADLLGVDLGAVTFEDFADAAREFLQRHAATAPGRMGRAAAHILEVEAARRDAQYDGGD